MIHLARWQDAPWPEQVDCIITDPPYSERTHKGQVNVRRGIDYASLTPEDVREWAGLERLTLTPAPSLLFDAPEQTELI